MAAGAPTSIWRLTPIAAACGAGLAIAAWTLPIPGVRVGELEPTTAGPAPVGVGAGSMDDYLPPIPKHDWTTLVPPLMEVRSPVPEAVPEDIIVDEPRPTDDVRRLSDWSFAGLVEEPGGFVAIVAIAGKQHYFRIGQVVMIEGGRTEALIVGVETDHVVVRVEGEDHRVLSTGPARGGNTGGSRGRTSTPMLNPNSSRTRPNTSGRT